MAWDEWARIKADVSARQDGADGPMRLNQLAPLGGGGAGGAAPDLASSPAEKKAASKALKEQLEPGVRRDGSRTAESMGAAAKEFGARDGSGWDAAGALKKAQETWEAQVKSLLGGLAREQSLLSATAVTLGGTDAGIAVQMNRQSRIDGL
ncbi:hypothetical protein GCM10010232_40480 [Streptomyces amakusaensis]|uniref:Uncharacterized protein n=1 Tax=Streptomyces amakusaensis TaxID=67271 RepID=A0ABW0AGN5_9ACTN